MTQKKLYFLGPFGSFSEKAATMFVRKSEEELLLTEAINLEKIARDLSDNQSYGIMAYYNYLEGLVQETLDLIYEYKLTILECIRVTIVFSAGKYPGSNNNQFVYAHPKGLAQTSDWIHDNYPDLKQIPLNSNSESVFKVKQEKTGIAIAHEDILKEQQLDIIARDIGNQKHGNINFTDFYVITNNNKLDYNSQKRYLTMVAITPHFDKPGLLAQILFQISSFGLNNVKIHSRPAIDDVRIENISPQMFYLEVFCHQSEERFIKCIDTLNYILNPEKKEIEVVRILGSYEDTNS